MMGIWVRGQRLVILLLCASTVILSSCSKTSRARRSLRASQETYQKSKELLLVGKVEQAQKSAQQALSQAKRGADLMPSNTSDEAVRKRVEMARLLASAFDDPRYVVSLWYQAIGEADSSLVAFLFDEKAVMSVVFAEIYQNMSAQEKERLERPLLNTLDETIKNYKEIVSTVNTEAVTEEVVDNEATVRCTMLIPSMNTETTHWIHLRKRDGFWRICDFTLGEVEGKRITSLLRGKRWGDDPAQELEEILRGKDLYEALATIREDYAVARPQSEEKPLLNRYVRTIEVCKLNRAGQRVPIEKGTVLKVLDQRKVGDSESLLLVRTAEAEASESSTGEIPESIVEVVGSDEGLLWGVGQE